MWCRCFLDKNRGLADAQAEIKSLRLLDRLKQKAVDEVHIQLHVLFALEEYGTSSFRECEVMEFT